jgi:hypothetical protein
VKLQCCQCGIILSSEFAFERKGKIYCTMHCPEDKIVEIPFSEKTNLMYNFLYFYHMDNANACIHMQPVKYSPITFMLAEKCIKEDVHTMGYALEVKMHKGKYEMDTGR